MAAFEAHPAVAPLIAGGRMVEYSAHLVPEGGVAMMPEVVGDGILVAGDAAGFVLNLGYAVRGMDFAMASGMHAAETLIAAKAKNDFGKAELKNYLTRLKQSFVLRDLEFYKHAPHFIGSTPRMFGAYPKVATDMLRRLFTVDGTTPPKHAVTLAREALKGRASLWQVAKDGLRGGRAL